MSDDDWENALDEAVENDGKEETKKQDKFADEDAYDSDEERRKKSEAAKAAKIVEPTRVKTQSKDYDKMFEDRNKKRGVATTIAGQSNGLKGEMASRQAEEDITEQLFKSEVGVDSSTLKSEKDYVNFAQ